MIRKKIDNALAERRVLSVEHKEVEKEMEIVDDSLRFHDEARIIIQKSAQIVQKNLEEHISGIVSKALRIVFLDEAKEFHVEFVTRRNVTECDLKLVEHGNLLDPLDSCGFGEADVCSFALRVAYWALGTTRNALIVDEPFKFLDGDRIKRAFEMVQVLSDELNLQMIIITHENEAQGHYSKRFHVVKKGKESTVISENAERFKIN